MHIFCMLHVYPTYHKTSHMAGAEFYCKAIFEYLHSVHKCRISILAPPKTLNGKDQETINGIDIYCKISEEKLKELNISSDVHFGHLDLTKQVVYTAKRYRKPLIYISHNKDSIRHWQLKPSDYHLSLFNSNWLYRQVSETRPSPSFVVHPPIWINNYKRDNISRLPKLERKIMLSNLAALKGSELFYKLAELLPERRFLGIRGVYAHQIIKNLPNVEICDPDPDIKKYLKQADLVLQCSKEESWGRIAIESSAAGIPVLASPTEGLKESMGSNGIFLDPKDPQAWIQAINEMDSDELWYSQQEKMLRRANELEKIATRQLDDLYVAMENLVVQNPVQVFGIGKSSIEELKQVPKINRGPVISSIEDGVEIMEKGLVSLPHGPKAPEFLWKPRGWIGMLRGLSGKVALAMDDKAKREAEDIGLLSCQEAKQAMNLARNDFFKDGEPAYVRVVRPHSDPNYGMLIQDQELFMKKDQRLTDLVKNRLVQILDN